MAGVHGVLVGVALSACASSPPVFPVRPTVPPALGTGCRFAERALARHEAVERWPAPERIAEGLDGVYVGRIRWRDAASGPSARIRVTVQVDRDAFVLRDVVEGPRPQERIICRSSMVVPVSLTVRLGDHEARVRAVTVTYDGRLSLAAALPPAFASRFAAAHTDGFRVHVMIPTDDGALGGGFSFMKPGMRGGQVAHFSARRRRPGSAPTRPTPTPHQPCSRCQVASERSG